MTREQRLEQDGDLEPILFYRPQAEYGEFSNFSRHTITAIDPWTNKYRTYLTGEHMYQALKADNQDDYEYVLEVDNPGAAKNRGRQVKLRAGWGNKRGDLCYYVMLDIVMRKAVQHDTIMHALFHTVGHNIYEDSPIDDIWGWRYRDSHTGKNLLGLCWMECRYYMFEV